MILHFRRRDANRKKHTRPNFLLADTVSNLAREMPCTLVHAWVAQPWLMCQFYALDGFKSTGSHSVSIFKFQAFLVQLDKVCDLQVRRGRLHLFLIFDLRQNPDVYTLYTLLLKFKLVYLNCKQKHHLLNICYVLWFSTWVPFEKTISAKLETDRIICWL